MELKDWIVLIVPIFLNGVIVFALEKIFEKRQNVHAIKFEYAAEVRQIIDKALSLHAKALKLNQSVNSDIKEVSKILSDFIDASADVYYIFNENRTVLVSLNSIMEKLVADIQSAVDYIHSSNINENKYYSLMQNIHDTLLAAKEQCVKI